MALTSFLLPIKTINIPTHSYSRKIQLILILQKFFSSIISELICDLPPVEIAEMACYGGNFKSYQPSWSFYIVNLKQSFCENNEIRHMASWTKQVWLFSRKKRQLSIAYYEIVGVKLIIFIILVAHIRWGLLIKSFVPKKISYSLNCLLNCGGSDIISLYNSVWAYLM